MLGGHTRLRHAWNYSLRRAEAHNRAPQRCIGAGGLLLGGAYVTDVSHWPRRLDALRALIALATALALGFGTLLYVAEARRSLCNDKEAEHVLC